MPPTRMRMSSVAGGAVVSIKPCLEIAEVIIALDSSFAPSDRSAPFVRP
jgi:hypothetical protein